jgi:DNA invertase Pin-like site-specific DNA recombinase
MLIGYARISTFEPEDGLALQVRDLKAIGCERICTEISPAGHRRQIEGILEALRPGDVLAITAIHRLARSMAELIDIAALIKSLGASLRITELALDTTTQSGQMTLNMFGAVAHFDQSIKIERASATAQKWFGHHLDNNGGSSC